MPIRRNIFRQLRFETRIEAIHRSLQTEHESDADMDGNMDLDAQLDGVTAPPSSPRLIYLNDRPLSPMPSSTASTMNSGVESTRSAAASQTSTNTHANGSTHKERLSTLKGTALSVASSSLTEIQDLTAITLMAARGRMSARLSSTRSHAQQQAKRGHASHSRGFHFPPADPQLAPAYVQRRAARSIQNNSASMVGAGLGIERSRVMGHLLSGRTHAAASSTQQEAGAVSGSRPTQLNSGNPLNVAPLSHPITTTLTQGYDGPTTVSRIHQAFEILHDTINNAELQSQEQSRAFIEAMMAGCEHINRASVIAANPQDFQDKVEDDHHDDDVEVIKHTFKPYLWPPRTVVPRVRGRYKPECRHANAAELIDSRAAAEAATKITKKKDGKGATRKEVRTLLQGDKELQGVLQDIISERTFNEQRKLGSSRKTVENTGENTEGMNDCVVFGPHEGVTKVAAPTFVFSLPMRPKQAPTSRPAQSNDARDGQHNP